MRPFFKLVLPLAIIAAPLAAQQSADSIVAQYIARSGGASTIAAVTTLRRTGRFIGGGGFEARILYEAKRANMVREEFGFGGMVGITAYDGSKGWKVEPFNGRKDVQPMAEDEMRGLLEDAEFEDPLLSYAREGNKLEYLGTDVADGTDVYKLRLTLASNGDVRTYFIDKDYYLPIKYDVKRVIRGAEREFEVTVGNFKPVNGWYLPYSITIGDKGSPASDRVNYAFTSIEANVALDNALFTEPAAGVSPVPQLNVLPPVAAAAPAAKPVPLPAAMGTAAATRVDSETTAGIAARNIGSAEMSGRIAALAAVQDGDRLTVYVGAASGGVWKSMNGGTTYKPVFDKETVQSIGAITIDPTNSKVIWVGTGEAWIRNSVSVGDGIYKSTDGGETWTNMGLRESEHIVKIIVSAADANTVYACVPGKAFSDSPDRGVYKTTDGGKTWNKMLAGNNASTGCSMMSMDSQNANTLYAGMWDFRRQGWTFRSGGNGADAPSGSGLFKSTDGGATWSSLDSASAKGLPAKPWGRVAVSVAPSKPNVVYAFVEAAAPNGALYRSDDGGATWTRKDRSQNMVWRPFYFANLIVDPKNENRIFKPDGPLIMSTNGGTTFNFVNGGTHGDHHVVWIDPNNTDHLITGDDGGIWYSMDGGDKWWKAGNLPSVPVLSREPGHGPAVQCLRRTAGQQLVGGELVVSGRDHEQPLGEHVRRRRLLDVDRSERPDVHLRRGAGRQHRTREPQDARDARHSAAARLQGGETPLQLEHADHGESHAEGHRVHRRAIPLPVARPRTELAAHLSRSHDERSREAEAGGVGRYHRRQLVGGDAHHHLRDLGVAQGSERRLGGHRRRQSAGHA